MCTKHLSMLIWRTNALADAHSVSATIPIRSAVQIHSGTSMIRVWRILKGCWWFWFHRLQGACILWLRRTDFSSWQYAWNRKICKGKAPRHQTQTQHKRSFWQNQQQAHSWVDFKVYWFCFNQPQYLFIGKVWRSLPSCFDHAYESMLKFAEDAKKYFEHTQFSIVDTIPEEDIKACQKIADDRGIYLKIRKYSD